MQYETTINTLQTTLSISDRFKMQEELEKFQDMKVEDGTFKLIVDFKEIDLAFQGNQFDVGVIKYKKSKKNLKKAEIDLKNRNPNDQNLF